MMEFIPFAGIVSIWEIRNRETNKSMNKKKNKQKDMVCWKWKKINIILSL